MDCVEFDKKIDSFLHDELNDEELNAFLLHLNSCSNCREELEINYIVKEGVLRLDHDRMDYNLSAAYSGTIDENRRSLRERKIMIRLSYIIGTFAFWEVLMVIFVFFRILIMGS